MDALSVAAGTISLVQLIYHNGVNPFRRLRFYTKFYGYAGILLLCFGNTAVWKMQLEVLVSDDTQSALDFKRARQKESDTVAIAGSILAQIAIISFSLNDLSQAHWTAQGFFTFSLVASVISVYHASARQKALSRLLNPEDIRIWIRRKEADTDPLQTHFGGFPSVAAVLTVSAPNALLSLAVHAFLVGLGIYLGFIWTKGLNLPSTVSDNRAVFITYIVSLFICYCIYAISNIAVSGQTDEQVLFRKLVDRAQSISTTTDTTSSPVNTSDRQPRFQDSSFQLQQLLRESARLKRELTTLDDSIAYLLGNRPS